MNLLQASDILGKLKVRIEDGKTVFDFLTSFLTYLPVGDTLRTSTADFTKVDNEFIRITNKVKSKEVISDLESNRIIKIV